jgi:conjugative transfer signal peptidase TraF
MNRVLYTSRHWHRVSRKLALAGMLVPLAIALFGLMGARVNMTASLPLGLYWVTNQPITRGVYIRFCPPAEGAFALAKDRGYLGAGHCPDGYAPMIKRVSGVAGDGVMVNEDGIQIDGKLLPLSARKHADPHGRPLPKPDQAHYVLRPSQLWVMSDTNDHSFDSRYFGPIDRSWVVDVIRPSLTWGYGGTLSHLQEKLASAGL